MYVTHVLSVWQCFDGYDSSLAVAGLCDFRSQERWQLTGTIGRHIHVSLRDANGKSLFAISEAETKTGRQDVANEETKFISQEAEWFLAGVLDGLPDGKHSIRYLFGRADNFSQSCPQYVTL